MVVWSGLAVASAALKAGWRVGWGVRPWVGVQELYMGGTGGSVASDYYFWTFILPCGGGNLVLFLYLYVGGGKKGKTRICLEWSHKKINILRAMREREKEKKRRRWQEKREARTPPVRPLQTRLSDGQWINTSLSFTVSCASIGVNLHIQKDYGKNLGLIVVRVQLTLTCFSIIHQK